MNIPNVITLSRIPTLFLIVGLLAFRWKWVTTAAEVLVILTALSDLLDGCLARRKSIESNFGKWMDALVDKIFINGLLVMLLGIKVLPGWSSFFIVMMLCREFLISGLRIMAAAQGTVLAAENWGKFKTFLQFISIGLLIAGQMVTVDLGLGQDTALYLWLHNGGLILFFVAMAMTILSGMHYFIRYRSLFWKD